MKNYYKSTILSTPVATKSYKSTNQTRFRKDKIARSVKACDDNNEFSEYVPAIDKLNDVDITQTKKKIIVATEQMGLTSLNRKIDALEEQRIYNRLAIIFDELNDNTTFAKQKEIERRYFEH